MRKYINLCELTGYKNNTELNHFKSVMEPIDGYASISDRRTVLSGFLEYLEKQGYTPINNGSFGAVFTHPGLDYVVKIFKDDPAYMQFLRYALAHQDNPTLPKFRGKIMKVDDHHYAVRMEHLTPVKVTTILKQACDALSLMVNVWPKCKSFKEFVQLLPMMFSYDINKTRSLAFFLTQNRGLFDTILDLHHANTGKFHFDLHAANLMMRGKAYVIIDPYLNIESVFNDEEIRKNLG